MMRRYLRLNTLTYMFWLFYSSYYIYMYHIQYMHNRLDKKH